MHVLMRSTFIVVLGTYVTSCNLFVPYDFPIVTAEIETDPAKAANTEDAADDPAIYIHPSDPEKSYIIGTNKTAGLSVYDLQGREIYFTPCGRPNNVDVRYNFILNQKDTIDIVACSERNNNEILVYRIHADSGRLTLLSGGRLKTSMKEAYGFCLYQSPMDKQTYAFINDKNGKIEQWLLQPFQDSLISGKLVATRSVTTQPECMVADDLNALLFVGEEERGIWQFKAEPGEQEAPIFVKGSGILNLNISFDIEGLTLFSPPNGENYLIASSQGNNSYAIFSRKDSIRYLGSFKIGKNANIDGTTECS